MKIQPYRPVLLVAGFVTAGVLLWWALSSGPPSMGAVKGEERAASALTTSSPLLSHAAPTAPDAPGSARVELAAPSSPPASSATIEAQADVPREVLNSIDGSLSGSLNFEDFVSLALSLLECEISEAPLPEPHATGATRFPIRGTPEGLIGEVWVRRTTNPEFARNIMSVRVEIERADGTLPVEGVLRGVASASMTLWVDPSGRPVIFGVTTESQPHRNTGRLGWPIADNDVPFGMQATYRVDGATGPSSALYGVSGGAYGDLDRPTQILGAPPSFERLDALSVAFGRWARRVGLRD